MFVAHSDGGWVERGKQRTYAASVQRVQASGFNEVDKHEVFVGCHGSGIYEGEVGREVGVKSSSLPRTPEGEGSGGSELRDAPRIQSMR
jgi:hypothetical protein